MTKRLTDEDYIEIRKRVEDARKLPFVTWGASKLIEGDVPALLEEVERLRKNEIEYRSMLIRLRYDVLGTDSEWENELFQLIYKSKDK